jgi:hypothetical protein
MLINILKVVSLTLIVANIVSSSYMIYKGFHYKVDSLIAWVTMFTFFVMAIQLEEYNNMNK